MPNDLTEVIPKILAQGLMALRENCVMPQLVNFDYGEDAKQKGETVDVPIPSAIAAQQVAPAAFAPDPGDLAPTSVPITLDQWYEAPFYMTDRDLSIAMDGTIPMQASEAIKAISNQVNGYLFGQYVKIGGSHGTPGQTPFATDTSDATQTRKILNIQLAPLDSRRFVLDPDAEANALDLRAFQDYGWSNALDVIRSGRISEQRLGFDWFMDQMVPTHTSGDATGFSTDTSGYAKGSKGPITISGGTGDFNVGDVITFAGDSVQYAVTRWSGGTIDVSPGLQQDIPTAATAITMVNAGAVDSPQNLAFHRDCIGFASRPLVDETEGLGNMLMSAVDPVSGLALRLEVSREHKRTRWSYDLLWGANVVRAELGARLWG